MPALVCCAVAGAIAWLALRLRRRFTRYEIAGESMLPALRSGDWVIVDRLAWEHSEPCEGEVALVRDPRDPRRTLVKRIGICEPGGEFFLLGDNAEASTDSRTLGSFPPEALLGRVRWRYWPPPPGIEFPTPAQRAAAPKRV